MLRKQKQKTIASIEVLLFNFYTERLTLLIGYLKNYAKHGQGTLVNKDGSIYNGEFDRDKRHGYGRFKNLNGDIYEGYWENDEPKGKGFYQTRAGVSYIANDEDGDQVWY